jgi:formate dehydrogenase major subunit
VVGLITALGAGGGTSSYREVEDADVIVLWGSNAREAHPIFFHHVLTAVHRGARLIVVDPRRTPTARFADTWLGLDVGTDIALAHAIGREIIANGWHHRAFIERATTGFDDYRHCVEPWTLERAEAVTGVPADVIREVAQAYATAPRAQLGWTLGITEHLTGVDNVLALINLALLTGHVGRWGSGLQPLRGQNNVQGGGDMGALPNRLPGFHDVEDDAARARFETAWGTTIPSRNGMHLTEMFHAMERSDLRGLFIVGENPAQSEPNSTHVLELLGDLDHLVVQDLFLTRTARLADVVFPAAAAWCEADGTVTNSERRVQRVRKAIEPPGQAKDDLEIVTMLARRLGHDWADPVAEQVWDELRSLSPAHHGMTYARLESEGGLQWPCPSLDSLEPPFLHGRLWSDNPSVLGRRAPFGIVEWLPPVDVLSPEFPLRLTTGRRLDGYNTGVQSNRFSTPTRTRQTIDIGPMDADAIGLREGDDVVITSRRGSIEVPVHIEPSLRAGLVFMSIHAPDEVDVNRLTVDITDPRSGTAEFKATAVRIEKR